MFARTLAPVLAASLAIAMVVQAQDCPVHLLGREDGEFRLSRESVPDGQTRVFIQTENLVSLVLPWSAGQSGEVVQPAQGPHAYAARCEAGSVVVTVQKQGAAPRQLPPVAADALSRFRIRVSVIPGSGRSAVFVITPDGGISRDTTAPPTDMFRGMVPLQPADVSITTEIREIRAGSVTGSAELRRGGPYFLATLELSGGGTGQVIVDLGASRTLLTRNVLPPGIEPSPLVAVEYGPEGQRARRGSMGALAGQISAVATARVPRITIGSLSFSDVRVNIVDSLPLIGGAEIAGILGVDLLGAGPITRLEAGSAGGRLSLVTNGEPEPSLEAPFSLVGGLVLIPARAGQRLIPLILDTGARSTLLSESAASALGLETMPGGDTFHGLDGTPVRTWSAVIPALHLGSGRLDSLAVNVAPLPVLEAMGITDGGLLGQNLWERFSALELDWQNNVVRFYTRPR